MTDEVEYLTAGWHEAKAADLLRPRTLRGSSSTVNPSEGDIEMAKAHAATAQSIRTGQLAAAIRDAGDLNRDGLGRVADRLHIGLRSRR